MDEKRKVLVIDDDPDVRALLNVWLRDSEFQMIAGADGYQAVELTRRHEPAVILLDIKLPAANGFVVHERLKNMSGVGTIPIVYISADRKAEPRAIAAGGVRFLAKPLDKERTLSTLREVCHSVA